MAAISLSERLQQAADRCCQDEEGFEAAEISTRMFLNLLESPLHDQERKQASPAIWLAECEQALQQAGELLDPSASSSSSGLVLCEKIGLELPKVVVKFVSLSQKCQDHCLSIVEVLAENGNPREMFAAFMEALNIYTAPQTLICCIPLIQGLSLAFARLQRRQSRFFQEASSGLVALVHLTALQDDDDDAEDEETLIENLVVVPQGQVHAAILENIVQFTQVVREICDAVNVDEQREDFQRRLGMFALQILGITGEKIARPECEVPASVMELVALLPLCNLSISLLLTRKNQIEVLAETTSDDVTEGADHTAQNNQKKLEATKGAALAAYWILCKNQGAAKGALKSIREDFQATGRNGVVTALSIASFLLTTSVPAFGVTLVETILTLASYSDFLSDVDEEEKEDGCLALSLQILPSLQRLQNVVVYAPSVETRRQAYAALRKVICEVLPSAARLQCLQMLINNCPFPSLVSLHLICIRDEIGRAWPSGAHQQGQPSTDTKSTTEKQQSKHVASPFLSGDILEVVGNVLRPETGVPPDLPAQIDSVQSALNLYRFILIRESSGKTNYTGVLSKQALTKARLQWLLPLRELMGGVSLSLAMENSDMSADMSLAMDALQSVLYRCLELNEEALARC